MSVTDVQICNMALQELGANRIINLTTETKEEATLCNLFYRPVVDEVLRSHPWNCATWYQTLAQVDSGDADYLLTNFDKWEYQYALPVNPYCLRVLEISDYPDADYEIVRDYLLCNLETTATTVVKLKYIQRIEDESKFDSLLVRAIAYRLAADLTDKLTNSRKTRSEMLELFEWALRNARAIDGLESTAPDVDNDDWKTAGGWR